MQFGYSTQSQFKFQVVAVYGTERTNNWTARENVGVFEITLY